MKKILLVAGGSLLAHAGLAQTQPVTTSFFTAFLDSAVVTEPAQGTYRVNRTEVPGESRLDSTFYVASGRLLRTRAATWLPAGDTLTTITMWRANGTRASVSQERGANHPREQLNYNAEGQLVRKAVWEQKKEIQAECFSAAGVPVACSEYQYTEKMPEFPGGYQALLNYIGRSVRYPGKALKKRQGGIVSVLFVVAETGQVRCVQVKQGVSPELDAEAVRVMRSLPRFEPGRQNGEAVPVYFTVPVTFAIR